MDRSGQSAAVVSKALFMYSGRVADAFEWLRSERAQRDAEWASEEDACLVQADVRRGDEIRNRRGLDAVEARLKFLGRPSMDVVGNSPP